MSALRPPSAGGWLLISAATLFLFVLVGAPLAAVFITAFSRGVPAFLAAITSSDAVASLELTLLTIAIAVPLNTVFGVAAAWALTKFDFRGRGVVLALIDVPLTASPVVAGLLFVLLFGSRGWFSTIPNDWGVPIIYAPAGIVIATTFVTLPYVVRELVPLMHSLGRDDELAARSLGASGWATFRRVTLPNVRWGLVYGVLACAGRALGEFGAVSVVSGHIRGETTTLTLHVELLYNEYDQAGAFSVAALLTSFSIIALVIRKIVARSARSRS